MFNRVLIIDLTLLFIIVVDHLGAHINTLAHLFLFERELYELIPRSLHLCFVRGVRDIWIQILPKAPNLTQRSPMSYCLDF